MLLLRPIEWVYLALAFGLLLLSGFFAAAEIGLLSVNRFRVHQLAESGAKRAHVLQRLLLNPSRPLTVILILITALNYANESLVTHWLTGPLRHYASWVPFILLLALVLIFAEITPINYAAANPELVALRSAGIIHLATVIFRPVLRYLPISPASSSVCSAACRDNCRLSPKRKYGRSSIAKPSAVC